MLVCGSSRLFCGGDREAGHMESNTFVTRRFMFVSEMFAVTVAKNVL